MKLCNYQDVSPTCGEQTFRYRPWGAMVLLVMCLGCATLCVFALSQWAPPWWVYIIGSPVLLSAALLAYVLFTGLARALFACFKPSNWVMIVTPSGVYLQVRSYLNCHFPDDGPTVAYIAFNEIKAVQATTERMPVIDHEGDRVIRVKRFLDLHLVRPDAAPLAALVRQERTRPGPKTGLSRLRFQHVPVSAPEPDLVRVEWRGRRMLRVLNQYVQTLPANRVSYDMDAKPADAASDDRVVKLIEQGDDMEARRILHRCHGMSMIEAKKFVEDLVSPNELVQTPALAEQV